MIKKPSLRGLSVEEAIARIDTWIAETTDELNYKLEHLDNTNMVSDFVTKDELKNLMKGD